MAYSRFFGTPLDISTTLCMQTQLISLTGLQKEEKKEKRADEEERGRGRRRRGRRDSGNLLFCITVVPQFYQWRYLT